MYVMVTSDTLTPGDVYDYAYRYIGKRSALLSMSMIEGVSKVDTYGSKFAIRVKVKPDRLASMGLSMADVQQALKTGTSALPGGSLDNAAHTLSVEPKGQLRKAEDYANLILAYRDGAPVRLGDVATCVNSVENDQVSVRYGLTKNGNVWDGGTCLPVSRAPGANTVQVAANLRDTLEELRTEIPGSINIDIMFDNSNADCGFHQ